MLESGNDNATCRAGHKLHIVENKRDGYAVRFADASPCDDNGSVRSNKLREPLWIIEVHSLTLVEESGENLLV